MERIKPIIASPTEVIELRNKSYKEIWDLQLHYLNEIIEGRKTGKNVTNKLLFVEHKPVFTLGKSANTQNLLVSQSLLEQKGIELFHIERGGDITFHGPGQWVVYPIFDLNKLNIGLRLYIEKLEKVIIDTCMSYGINAEQLEGLTGVWVNNPKKHPNWNKVAAIGVKCKRFVTMHGFALNVHTDLEYFQLMNPCGILDKGVTTISKETNQQITFEEIKEEILHQFTNHFTIKV